MDEPKRSARAVPWGVIAAGASLALAVFAVYRVQKNAPPACVAHLALAVVAAFLCGRILVGSLWGVIMALTLALHPAYDHWAMRNAEPLEGEALKLVALAGMLCAWRMLFRPQRSVLRLLLIGLLLAPVGALAWLASNEPGWGLATVMLVCIGLFAGSSLAAVRRRLVVSGPAPQVAGAPSLSNIWLGVALSVAVPAVACLLVLQLSHFHLLLESRGLGFHEVARRTILDGEQLAGMLQNAIQPGTTSWLPGFTESELRQWAWPWYQPELVGGNAALAIGAVIVILAAALVRAGWTGLGQWTRGQAPLAWVLVLYTAAVLASSWLDPVHPNSPGSELLPLACLAVLLPLFAVGDAIGGVGERLRLPPPQEETAIVRD